MKNTRVNILTRFAGISFALLLVAGATLEMSAQEKSGGKGGAQLLMKPAVAATASTAMPMRCGSCKDEFVTVKDPSARGANQPASRVARHACDGCQTTLQLQGEGKAKQQVAVHTCTASPTVEMACCGK